jgi:hypothetical protein
MSKPVIPAQAGTQGVRLPRASREALGPRLRGEDENREITP